MKNNLRNFIISLLYGKEIIDIHTKNQILQFTGNNTNLLIEVFDELINNNDKYNKEEYFDFFIFITDNLLNIINRKNENTNFIIPKIIIKAINDNINYTKLIALSKVRLKQLKESNKINQKNYIPIPTNAKGCLKVYENIITPMYHRNNIWIYFFDNNEYIEEQDYEYLLMEDCNKFFNPFNNYNYDCEEYEIGIGY